LRCLITGGAGFLGSWVAEQAAGEGDQVTVLDDFSEGKLKNIEHLRSAPKFKVIEGDVRRSSDVREPMRSVEVCFHLAAKVFVDESLRNPGLYKRVNVDGTLNLLEAARRFDVKMIFVSTCLIYDMTRDEPISEEHELKPSSPYAASKIAAESFVQAFHHAYGLPVVTLRPFNSYGPRQSFGAYGGVIARFIYKVLRNEPIPIYGDGSQTRDFLYAADCADALIAAAKSRAAVGKVLNIGSGTDIQITDLAEAILSLIPSKSRTVHVPHPHPQSEIMKLLCDYSKAKKVLDWEPRFTLKEGLRETIKWLRTEQSRA